MAKGKAKKEVKGKAKKEAKLKPKDLEKVDREAKSSALQACRENPAFRGFSSREIFSVLVNGKSLFQTVEADKKAKLLGSERVRFGGPYYKGLAAVFRGDKPAGESTQAVGNMSLRQELVEALIDWNDTPKRAGPLMEFMQLPEQVPLHFHVISF